MTNATAAYLDLDGASLRGAVAFGCKRLALGAVEVFVGPERRDHETPGAAPKP